MPRTGSGLAVLIAVAVVGLSAAPAAAHSDLRSAAPADGSVLNAPPQQVSLVFSENVQPSYSRVAVTRDGKVVTGAAGPVTAGSRVTQPVTVSVAGTYTVSYRIVSADGHAVQGLIRFRYAPPPALATRAAAPSSSANPVAPTVTEAPSTTAAAGGSNADSDGRLKTLVLVGPVLAALTAVGALLLLAYFRSRSARPDGGSNRAAGSAGDG